MLNRYLKLAIVIVALGGAIEASGQQATEMFIPIGQSPGLSSKESVIGTLESVDQGSRWSPYRVRLAHRRSGSRIGQ